MPLRYSFIALLLLAFAGCATVDFDYPREASVAIDANEDTTLKRRVDEWLAEHPGPSGFYPLVNGTDALGARLRLIEQAEKTIDAQYFLMKADSAGFVFGAALLEAADRGVRVRFLLDDIFTTVGERELAIIDGHPNVELRLFNPISRKGIDVFNYLGTFESANRRMHNKSFIVDNQIAIVGGRNIADEYFELNTGGEFRDFDMIAVGPAAAAVSEEFDAFWNHSRAVPAEAVVGKFSEEQIAQFLAKIDRQYLEEGRNIYREAVNSDLMRSFQARGRPLFSADATVLTDDPDKLVREISQENMILIQEMAEIVRSAKSEVVVATPYFVPGNEGVEFWRSIVDKGVRVVIVTNSLAANNHTAVHSAYARYRKDIILAGVELYEARANAVSETREGAPQPKAMTMHTKAMIFDRERLFVGSLNLDPRSIEINSEMGMIVDSAEMTGELADKLFENLGKWTYRVKLNDDGQLRWHATIDGVEVVETSEPLASWWQKFSAWFLKIAPERQL
ncbi:MAG: phospholipase D family protein [Betaproteobacteria bacterium]|nr:MAG: phospholipase D family protein [Betaproteobacteria bacterium]